MKKYSLLVGLAVLALALPAQGITWDVVYDGDVLPTTVGWTEVGTDGTVSLGTEGSTDYLTIDTDGGQDKRYFELASPYDADFTQGISVEFRARLYDGSMHAGLPAFSDGVYGYDMRFLHSTPDNHFPGYWRIEGAGRSYIAVGAVDPSVWNTYLITCTDTDYEFYVNDVLTKTAAIGVLADADGCANFTDSIWMGDYIAANVNDIIIDVDYLKVALGEVPEPMTMSLLLAGVGFLARRRRR